MKKVLITAGLIVVVAGIGVTLISSRQTYEPAIVARATSTPTSSEASVVATAQDARSTESAAKIAECATNLEAEVTKNKTSYEKGTILVSFERGTGEEQISAVLKDHSLVFASRSGTSTSPQIWGTAGVQRGKEFGTVCALRADSRIKYAGLNPLIELHE